MLIHGAFCLDIHSPHSPFTLRNRRTICKSESIQPAFLVGCQAAQENTVWFVLCTNLNSLYPLGIVKGGLQRQTQTWRKYPINLQDISREAPFHAANDVTFCASMSKCHNKLLHIIPCFYLMLALCVGCVISSFRLRCCGGGGMVIKCVWGGEGNRKQNCVDDYNFTGFRIENIVNAVQSIAWKPQPVHRRLRSYRVTIGHLFICPLFNPS